MKYDCTVVVSSCDTYEDTWYPFFKIMDSQWNDRPYPVVLNTESKAFTYGDMNIKTFQFYKPGEKVPWGKRLIKTLKAIDSKYILFMLDDFFLLKPVQQARIEECIKWLEEDESIAVFSFWRTHQPNIKDGKYPHFERRPQDGEYRLNCQAAIWRREKLISYIRPHEDPWQWEILGSKRSSRYKEKFYSAIENEPYIMEYDWFAGGGVHRGKWTRGCVDLFKKYDIKCDFSLRGFSDEKVEVNSEEMVRSSFVVRAGRKFMRKLKEKIICFKSLR